MVQINETKYQGLMRKIFNDLKETYPELLMFGDNKPNDELPTFDDVEGMSIDFNNEARYGNLKLSYKICGQTSTVDVVLENI